MIYIVSGYKRCGTSMMMQTLAAGGLEPAYSSERDDQLNGHLGDDNYRPNDSYYELGPGAMRSNFDQFEGKVVKFLFSGILMMPVGEYRIIFMRRPTAEIRKSCLAAFGQPDRMVERWDFEERIEAIIGAARDRRSVVTLDEVQYHDMLRNPVTTLESLDWPIDVMAAAKVPTCAKYRMQVPA